MEKRLFIGAMGGFIAGIIKDLPDALFHYGLKITNLTFWDYAGTIALGHHPQGLFEHIYAIMFEIIFSGLLGVIFVYFTTRFHAKKYPLWGGFYGAVIWFTIRAAVVGLDIKPLIGGEVVTASINSLDSIIYGIVLGYLVQYLEKKESLRE